MAYLEILRDWVRKRPQVHLALKAIKCWLLSLLPPRSYPGIPGRIHRCDPMLRCTQPKCFDHYKRVGEEAAHLVAEVAASLNRVENLLDFGCGYGRVLRFLVHKFDRMSVSAYDINKRALLFCVKEFGVFKESLDSSKGRLIKQYNLVWVGSVFTHLSRACAIETLAILASSLARDGVIVLTTHGEEAVQRLIDGFYKSEFLRYNRHVLDSFYTDGFAFVPYSYDINKSTGMTWISFSGMAQLVDEAAQGELRILSYEARAWDNHQDVYVIGKG